MKVYIVTSRERHWRGISGIECVRLTKEAAQAYINEAEKTNLHYVFDIEEFEATPSLTKDELDTIYSALHLYFGTVRNKENQLAGMDVMKKLKDIF